MSAGPPVAIEGPAGRGRGTSLPAWMASGVGATSMATTDTAAPQLAAEISSAGVVVASSQIQNVEIVMAVPAGDW